jgi:hypothetical protein
VVLDRGDSQLILSAGLAYSAAGVVRRIGVGKRMDGLAVCQDVHCGADTLAVFYRKSALERVGRLPGDVGDTVAGADIALRLRHAGFRAVFEPDCRTYADRLLLSEYSAVRQGLEAERLFWRWAPAGGWIRSLAGHAGLLTLECVLCPVRPATVCKLAGRMWGALSFASHRHHWQLIRKPDPPAGQAMGPPHFVATECRKPAESHTAG